MSDNVFAKYHLQMYDIKQWDKKLHRIIVYYYYYYIIIIIHILLLLLLYIIIIIIINDISSTVM